MSTKRMIKGRRTPSKRSVLEDLPSPTMRFPKQQKKEKRTGGATTAQKKKKARTDARTNSSGANSAKEKASSPPTEEDWQTACQTWISTIKDAAGSVTQKEYLRGDLSGPRFSGSPAQRKEFRSRLKKHRDDQALAERRAQEERDEKEEAEKADRSLGQELLHYEIGSRKEEDTELDATARIIHLLQTNPNNPYPASEVYQRYYNLLQEDLACLREIARYVNCHIPDRSFIPHLFPELPEI